MLNAIQEQETQDHSGSQIRTCPVYMWSIAERSREHWDDFKSIKTDLHIMKHQGEGEPEFHFKVGKHFKSALSRQVGEAIRLERRGVSSLNSKGEYNRCKISRLVLEQPMEKES